MEMRSTATSFIRLTPPGPERFGYISHGGEQIYFVHHAALGSVRGKVLLAGPFGLERQTSYSTWVRWARFLAHEGFDVLHFDYRGVGESTGRFQNMTISHWKDDLTACLRLLLGTDQSPIAVVGLRLGALLASEVFQDGDGDALLMWDPPLSATSHLSEQLRRKLASDLVDRIPGRRKTRDSYLQDLCAGAELDVEGYPWTRQLWFDAAAHRLQVPLPSEPRPWLLVQLDEPSQLRLETGERVATIRVPRPPFWGQDPRLVADLSELFTRSLAFLKQALDSPGRLS